MSNKFHILETRKGYPILIYQGRQFLLIKREGTILSWRCSNSTGQYGCTAVITTQGNSILIPPVHICKADPHSANRLLFEEMLRKKVREDLDTPVMEVFRSITEICNGAYGLPQWNEVKQYLYMEREKAAKAVEIIMSKKFHILETRKGYPTLIHQGRKFLLIKHEDTILSWRCSNSTGQYGCTAVITTQGNSILIPPVHICKADPHSANRLLFEEMLRKKVREDLDTPVMEVFRSITEICNGAYGLPQWNEVKQYLYMEREKAAKAVDSRQQLDDQFHLLSSGDGHISLLYGGYRYKLEKECGITSYWTCYEKDCKAKLTTFGEFPEPSVLDFTCHKCDARFSNNASTLFMYRLQLQVTTALSTPISQLYKSEYYKLYLCGNMLPHFSIIEDQLNSLRSKTLANLKKQGFFSNKDVPSDGK